MRILTGEPTVQEADREFVEMQIDELLDHLYRRAGGSEERFSDMLAHFVAMTVAPSLAATNMVLGMPKVCEKNREQQVRLSVSGDSSYINPLGVFETELAEAVTNAVLQTILGPSPRIPAFDPEEGIEDVCLN
jgi:hypothetical protein